MKILIFIFGLTIGFFLDICIYKKVQEESPNVSMKYRYYGKENLAIYSMVPFINGVMYILLYDHYTYFVDFIYYITISSILLVILFIDLKKMIISDYPVLLIFGITVIYKVLRCTSGNMWLEFSKGIGGLFLAGILFLSIVFLSGGGMGGGDVTLISSLGFILGIRYILLNIFLAFILAAATSLFLLSLKIKTKRDPIPFGPFIIVSFYIVLLYGQDILNWYLNKVI